MPPDRSEDLCRKHGSISLDGCHVDCHEGRARTPGRTLMTNDGVRNRQQADPEAG
jgi:hypothetical protein